MASPDTIIRKRDQTLTRLLSIKDVTPKQTPGPNRAARRKMLQNFARTSGVPYAEIRSMIKGEEEKMRAHGIDPHAKDALEQLKKAEANDV